jgi:hypothetical protein
MTRFTRPVVFSLLCLTCWVTPSFAAEWRVWTHIIIEVNGIPQPLGEDEWVQSITAPTERACTDLRDGDLGIATIGYMKGKFESSGATVNAVGRTVLVSWVNAQGSRRVMRNHLECWLDTVDPRGPKGK